MKPPAFQFYADDFLSGTAEMTPEEVGAYIRLLCHQWAKGGLPNEPERLARMAGAMPVPSLGYILAKFRLCEDGCLRNDRMERERAKQDAFRAEQAEKGKKGAEARWRNSSGHSPAMSPAMPVPQPNDGSPSPSPKTIKRERTVFVKPTLEEVKLQCAKVGLPESEADAFHAHHEARGWAYKQGSMKSWVAALNSWKINFDRGTFAPTNGSPSRNTPKSLARPPWAVLRDLKEEEKTLSDELHYDWDRAAAPEKVARLEEVRNAIAKIQSHTEAAPVESVR